MTSSSWCKSLVSTSSIIEIVVSVSVLKFLEPKNWKILRYYYNQKIEIKQRQTLSDMLKSVGSISTISCYSFCTYTEKHH